MAQQDWEERFREWETKTYAVGAKYEFNYNCVRGHSGRTMEVIVGSVDETLADILANSKCHCGANIASVEK